MRTFFGGQNLLRGSGPIGGGQNLLGLRGLRGGRPHKQHAPTGIVLGTIFVGGSLMAGDQLSPGDLMSFLVASQTVQRSVSPPHVTPAVPPPPPVPPHAELTPTPAGPWRTSPSSSGR